MTTLGTKTVVVAYSKTKQGAYCQAVSTFYTMEVTNPVASLEVTTLPNITTYYYYSSDSIIFNTAGIVVTGTYSDGTKAIIPNSTLKFGKIPAASGPQTAVISYVGATKTVTVTCPFTLVQGVSQVGTTNFSSGMVDRHSLLTLQSHQVRVRHLQCTATPTILQTGTALVQFFAKLTRQLNML